ncbi:solute carrier family 12 member 7-like protein [Lates japonicus]|uniref:Solute carrier family 12 member 7-like protein n=1 Tax=Lates japonicus TaxID=270547 RepID=A0AAD3R2Q8_LATJO|nr:solute carrier family 12 member 7-like protein [Lates japonicus]
MGERFVVVPVDGGGGVTGEREHSDAVVADPAPDTGGSSGGGTVEEEETGEDSVFEPQDPNVVVPILEYNREPNKYGKTAASCPTSYLIYLAAD